MPWRTVNVCQHYRGKLTQNHVGPNLNKKSIKISIKINILSMESENKIIPREIPIKQFCENFYLKRKKKT